MKYAFYLVGIIFMLLNVPAQGNAAATDSLPASALPLYGRCLLTGGRVELIGSASHVGFFFTGKECAVYAFVPDARVHGYLQYELDGVYQKRVRISASDGAEGGTAAPLVITAQGAGTHKVWIYKTTESLSGPVFISKISGHGLRPLKEPAAPLIEFIGNSITCGALSDVSEMPCGSGYSDYHNAYFAYGPRVARALGLNFILSSYSGMGVYRNWNSDGPTMPQVYEKADLQASGRRLWDFTKERPAIVSIALGTNDLSHGDGVRARLPFDSTMFINTYVQFVRLVKSKYPSARIALLSSPMIHGEDRLLLQRCLEAVKKKIDGLYPSGKRVAVFFFPPMNPRGCGFHPSVEDHAILAEELEPFFKKLL
ncbi:MAG TPA: GDSL-type esterase/lipase family protein [Puia sp.]|jgi:lysophospholipase L1-like esterase